MNFERITTNAHPMYASARELYGISFPTHEQREEPSQIAILGEKTYHFDLIYEGDAFVGLVLYWETEGYIYIEHLCILPQQRNRHYGQQALSLLAQRKKPLILEIDPPVDEISRRRKAFYERCGFVENPYPHVHPPYHRGCKGHELVIMSSPAGISPEEYDAFRHDLQEKVMYHAFA